jgi:hypothetical protein
MKAWVRMGILAVLAGLACGTALSADPPMPKVMSDAPATAGAWRMESPDMGKAAAAQMGGGMTLCQSAAQAMGPRDAGPDKDKGAPRCQFKMVEDSTTQAVMEIRCPDSNQRITINRVAPRSYLMSTQDLDEPAKKPLRMKMTYVGACSAKDSAVSLDKDSPACQQMRSQLGELDKAKASCAKSGDAKARASCEQMLEQSRSQITSMCGK